MDPSSPLLSRIAIDDAVFDGGMVDKRVDVDPSTLIRSRVALDSAVLDHGGGVKYTNAATHVRGVGLDDAVPYGGLRKEYTDPTSSITHTLCAAKKGQKEKKRGLFLNRGRAGHFPDLFDAAAQFPVHLDLPLNHSVGSTIAAITFQREGLCHLLEGRKKAFEQGKIDLIHGWLDKEKPLPEDATIVASLEKIPHAMVQTSLVFPLPKVLVGAGDLRYHYPPSPG